MSTRFDAKGKYFTHVVSKNEVAVLIQTLTHRIHGHVFLQPEQRLKDAMNTEEDFIAVANAEILDSKGGVLFASDFLTVNRTQIVWLMPDVQENPAGDATP